MPDHPTLAREFTRCLLDQLAQGRLKIEHCLAQLSDEQIWYRPAPDANSIGNLVIHIAGNLRQWGIVPLSDAVDQRKRDTEFAATLKMPRDEMINTLTTTVNECHSLWPACDDAEYLTRVTIQGFEVSLCEALMHTTAHLVGHTHQIILLTRQQLGSGYHFHWTPQQPRNQLPL